MPQDVRDCVNPSHVEYCTLRVNGDVPNNDHLPLLLYRQAVKLPQQDPAAIFEQLFADNRWPDGWRNGVFSFHHYHSTAHEVLGVYAGSATVQFGGEGGQTFNVQLGDVVVIPAGVAHKNISNSNVSVVGAYPRGQHPDMCRLDTSDGAAADIEVVRERIRNVPRPEFDPVYGVDGPLMLRWT